LYNKLFLKKKQRGTQNAIHFILGEKKKQTVPQLLAPHPFLTTVTSLTFYLVKMWLATFKENLEGKFL
jgi:hypothetical protein